jgi:hypothetical protein
VGKSKRGSKEYSREQRLNHENQRLKREVGRLRKELARIDLDRYESVKEAIEQHYQDDSAQQGREILEKIKKEWACNEPNCTGFLEIFTYNKMGATWYYRICSNSPSCRNRTKAQKWSPEVKGPMRGSDGRI